MFFNGFKPKKTKKGRRMIQKLLRQAQFNKEQGLGEHVQIMKNRKNELVKGNLFCPIKTMVKTQLLERKNKLLNRYDQEPMMSGFEKPTKNKSNGVGKVTVRNEFGFLR